MVDVTEFIRTVGSVHAEQITGQDFVMSGKVSINKPAPSAFGDPLYVTVAGVGDDYVVGPCNWSASQGATLPAQGAAVTVVFDMWRVPTVVWFDGVHS